MSNSSQMADLKLLLVEQGVVLWQHKWIALAGCWLACLIGWSAVMTMPRAYSSDARAFVDVNGLLTPLLKGLVVDTTTTQTSDYLRQTLLSRPNLEQVIHLAGLDAGKSALEKEALVGELSSRVVVKAQGKNLFGITYVNANPVTAKNVVEALLTIFAEKAATSSRVEMEKAHNFLDDQIAGYEKQLREAEQRRADFRKKYAQSLADPSSGTPKLLTLQQQMTQARQAYDSAVLTRDSLTQQLKEVPALRTVENPTVGQNGKLVAASPAVRLAQAKTDLADLQLKYTDLYPDVVSAKQQVKNLQAEVAATDPEAPGEGKSQVPNQTYEQIRLKLVEAEAAVPAAKQHLDQAMTDFNQLRVLSANLPDIDAKAKDLDRDYDVVKKNHDELIQRRQAATLSQAADEQADRTQFRIVDPPQIPLLPSFPNLPLMFSLVLLGGLAVGMALPIGLEQIHATYASAARLRTLGLPVLGTVAFVPRPGKQRRLAFGTTGAIVCAASLILTYGALMMGSIAFATAG